MAKIPQYTQDKLKSSLGYVAPVDTSGGQIANDIAQSSGQMAGAMMSEQAQFAHQDFANAVQKEQEIAKLQEKHQDILDGITAYQKSIDAEGQLNSIFDKHKQDYASDPVTGYKLMQQDGGKYIADTLANETNDNVKEKMSGILMNSYRGKLSELHSWTVSQGTANAQNQLGSAMDSLATQAGRARSIGEVSQLLNKATIAKPQLDMAFGAKASEILEKSKANISKSYVYNLLDNHPEMVGPTLDSKAFDSSITAEERTAFKKAAVNVIKSREEGDKFDKLLQIVSIRQQVAVAQANGSYTPSMGAAAMGKLTELEGGKGDYSTIIGATTDYIKDQKKLNDTQKKNEVLGSLYDSWYKITGGDDTINKSSQIEDIIKFQKEVEQASPYLTPQEKSKFMSKLTNSKMKRLKNMNPGFLGMGKSGDLADKDEFSGGYRYIYDWSKKHISDPNQRTQVMDEMVTTFTNAVDSVEKTQGGKPLTSKQKWNLLREVQNRAVKKVNPHLSNIPASGQRMADADGNVFIYYPDGSIERV